MLRLRKNLEGVTSGMASTERSHDIEGLFRDAGPGLWRSIYAYSAGRPDIADEAVAEAIAYRRGWRR